MSDLLPTIKNNILIGKPFPPGTRDILEKLYVALKEKKDEVLLTNPSNECSKSGNDIFREATNLSINLREQLGIKPDDVISIISESCIETVTLVLAVWKLGAVFAPINPVSTNEELLHLFNIINPKIIICSESVVSKVHQSSLKVPSVEKIVLLGDVQSEFMNFNSLLQTQEDEELEKPWRVPVPLSSVAVIYCSSGTTGLPKCVELTYLNMYFSYYNFVHSFKGLGKNVTGGILPLFHGYGMLSLLAALILKDHFIIFPRFELSFFLKSIEKYKISELFIVPPIMILLAKHPLVVETDLSSVRYVRFGAAPIRAEIIEAVRQRLPKEVRFSQGYGLTEVSICAALCPNVLPMPPGSVGIPSIGLETKILGTETQEPLGPNEKGELCFRGSLVMKGYKGNPEATSSIIDADGWLHTGDVGYYNDEGWLFVQERIKELIKYNAFQVSPTEIETILLQHPAVKDVAVWGQPNEEHGELPMAFVTLQPEMVATEQELQDFVAVQVSPYKKLRGGVQFVNEIPKNPSGKILRRKLSQLFIKQ